MIVATETVFEIEKTDKSGNGAIDICGHIFVIDHTPFLCTDVKCEHGHAIAAITILPTSCHHVMRIGGYGEIKPIESLYADGWTRK